MSTKRITTEVVDKAGEHRVNQKSSNGNITHASTEGYKNLKDLRNNEIDSAIAILEFYSEKITHEQSDELGRVALKVVTVHINRLTQAARDGNEVT